jgi:hypothetical protein
MPNPNFSIKIEADELIKFFNDMPSKFTDQVLGDIAQKGASVIRSEARRAMPIDGELGRMGKKAVVIARSKQNKTQRDVTIGGQYILYKGKNVSLGKIVRHMTAGKQKLRKTKRGKNRGLVSFQLGDFIHRAFERKKDMAVEVMKKSTFDIIKKRASKVTGLNYAG